MVQLIRTTKDHMIDDFDDAPGPGASLSRELRKARANMFMLNNAILDLMEQAATGDALSLKDMGIKADELQKAFQKADEAERKLNDWIAKHDGGELAGTLDLAAARAEVEGRLDQLRATLAADPAAGGDE